MQALRGLQFFVKGYMKFTKPKEDFSELQGTLEDKNYVITGANSGLGLAAAIFAASKKANVFIICRDQQKGEKAVKEIQEKSKNKNVELIVGEIGVKKDMDMIIRQLKNLKRIDILVHNAGCMSNTYKENQQNVQVNYATMVLGVYYLTKNLLPTFHPQTRTIIVSSGGMLTAPLINDDIFMKNDFNGTVQYARNKRMQVVLTQYFSSQFKNSGVFVSMHPGWVDTPGVRSSMPSFYNKMKNNLRTVEEGVDTINYLSVTSLDKIKNGEFYFDRQIAQKHLLVSGTSYNNNDVQEMIRKLEELSK